MAIEQPIDFSVPESAVMLALYLAVPEAENTRRGKRKRYPYYHVMMVVELELTRFYLIIAIKISFKNWYYQIVQSNYLRTF